MKRALAGFSLISTLIAITMALQGCAPPKDAQQNSCGFVTSREGDRVSWKRQIPVVMYLDNSFPKEYEVAIQNAMKTWNTNSQKQLFYLAPRRVTANDGRKEGLNVIFYHPNGEPVGPGKHAETYVSFVGDQMIKSDIHFSGAAGAFSYYMSRGPAEHRYNIEAVALHELGHVLGMKHPDLDSTNTVMSPKLMENNDRIELTKQDLTYLKCEY